MKDVDVSHQLHKFLERRSAVYYGPVLFDLAKVLGQEYATPCIPLKVHWMKQDLAAARYMGDPERVSIIL
jgi:hypothetical protein